MSRNYNHPDTVPPDTMNRREFLTLCAVGVLPAVLSACQGESPQESKAKPRPTGRPSPTNHASPTTQPSPSGTDWSDLSRALRGTLVRPNSQAYPTARQLFNPRFDNMFPAAIAYCASPADVATCLAFARLCWLLGTSVQKTRYLHQPDFPFLSLSSVERHGTAREMENGSLVFLEYIGRCLANQANTPHVCLVRKASTSVVKRKT